MLHTRMMTLLSLFSNYVPCSIFFTSFSFPKHNSGTIRNILMVYGMIIEQVSMECHMQE